MNRTGAAHFSVREMEHTKMRSLRIIISGMVQGVGYRYFAKRVADSLAVKGWVRNMPDGRVEVLAQVVDEDTEERFVQALKEGPPGGHVTGINRTPLENCKKYDSFEITF